MRKIYVIDTNILIHAPEAILNHRRVHSPMLAS